MRELSNLGMQGMKSAAASVHKAGEAARTVSAEMSQQLATHLEAFANALEAHLAPAAKSPVQTLGQLPMSRQIDAFVGPWLQNKLKALSPEELKKFPEMVKTVVQNRITEVQDAVIQKIDEVVKMTQTVEGFIRQFEAVAVKTAEKTLSSVDTVSEMAQQGRALAAVLPEIAKSPFDGLKKMIEVLEKTKIAVPALLHGTLDEKIPATVIAMKNAIVASGPGELKKAEKTLKDLEKFAGEFKKEMVSDPVKAMRHFVEIVESSKVELPLIFRALPRSVEESVKTAAESVKQVIVGLGSGELKKVEAFRAELNNQMGFGVSLGLRLASPSIAGLGLWVAGSSIGGAVAGALNPLPASRLVEEAMVPRDKQLAFLSSLQKNGLLEKGGVMSKAEFGKQLRAELSSTDVSQAQMELVVADFENRFAGGNLLAEQGVKLKAYRFDDLLKKLEAPLDVPPAQAALLKVRMREAVATICARQITVSRDDSKFTEKALAKVVNDPHLKTFLRADHARHEKFAKTTMALVNSDRFRDFVRSLADGRILSLVKTAPELLFNPEKLLHKLGTRTKEFETLAVTFRNMATTPQFSGFMANLISLKTGMEEKTVAGLIKNAASPSVDSAKSSAVLLLSDPKVKSEMNDQLTARLSGTLDTQTVNELSKLLEKTQEQVVGLLSGEGSATEFGQDLLASALPIVMQDSKVQAEITRGLDRLVGGRVSGTIRTAIEAAVTNLGESVLKDSKIQAELQKQFSAMVDEKASSEAVKYVLNKAGHAVIRSLANLDEVKLNIAALASGTIPDDVELVVKKHVTEMLAQPKIRDEVLSVLEKDIASDYRRKFVLEMGKLLIGATTDTKGLKDSVTEGVRQSIKTRAMAAMPSILPAVAQRRIYDEVEKAVLAKLSEVKLEADVTLEGFSSLFV